MNLFAGRSRRHRCIAWTCGHREEGEGGMNGKSSINMYTVSCVKQVAGGKLLHATEPSLAFCDDLEGW